MNGSYLQNVRFRTVDKGLRVLKIFSKMIY